MRVATFTDLGRNSISILHKLERCLYKNLLYLDQIFSRINNILKRHHFIRAAFTVQIAI